MIKLIQNIDVYAPDHLGKKDVLIIHDKIVKIADPGSSVTSLHIFQSLSKLMEQI